MMKRKMLIPVLAVLLCVSLIGVGYAAWVITTANQADVAGGNNFVVYDVQSRYVDFTSVTSSEKIVFGSATFDAGDGKTNYNWLSLKDGNAQNLTVTVIVTINNWSAIKTETITFALSEVDIINKTTQNSVKATYANYVTVPAVRTVTITNGVLDATSTNADFAFSANGDTATLYIPVTFGWGAAFDNVNPIQYFNEHTPEDEINKSNPDYVAETCDTYLEQASKSLKALYALNSANVQYKMTITATIQN